MSYRLPRNVRATLRRAVPATPVTPEPVMVVLALTKHEAATVADALRAGLRQFGPGQATIANALLRTLDSAK